MTNFAIIIPVMRRESLLSITRHYLSFDSELCGKIYIADYDPGFTCNLLGDEIEHAGLEHLHIADQGYFNKATAINLAASKAKEAFLLICDADVALPSRLVREWLDILKLRENVLIHLETVQETDGGAIRPGFGIVAIGRKAFENLQGYSSEFRGWGFEDRDFLSRAEIAGISVKAIGTAPHFSHSEEARTENYEEKIRLLSRERNLRLFEERRVAGKIHGTLASDLRVLRCP
jgi:hypothetical protein